MNYSFASAFASDQEALKPGQTHKPETDDSALVYANNFWIGDNKIINSGATESIDCTKGFDLKNYLLTKLRAINSAYKVTGKNGQWNFSASGAPTISTNITNDGNMVASSAATSAGLRPNMIYLHSVQGGGGNLNIVITNNEGKISEVINTEAFGKPLASVFSDDEINTIKLVHGDRCDQNIERWTAGGSNDGLDGKGIKETIRHLKRLKDSNNPEITKVCNVLGLSESEFRASSLLEEGFKPSNSGISEAATKKVKPQSFLRFLLAIFSKQNKDEDKLAQALLKHQNWITAETIKRNPKLQKIKSENSNHQIAQLSYHGGTIAGRLSVPEVLENFKSQLGINNVVKHYPDLDGSVDLTEAQLASKA